MAETQFQTRVRLVDQMPRQAESLHFIAAESEGLSESQRRSLAFAADMMRDAARLLAELN